MSLTPDQELRRELLLFSLNQHPDLATAMAMAAEMERFVLEGRPSEGKPCEAGHRLQRAAVEEARLAVQAEEVAARSPSAEEKSPGRAPEALEGPFGLGSQKRRWSDADDVRFKELWASEQPLEEIAEQLNRTVPSLYSRARALGLPRRSPAVQERPQTGAAKDRKDNAGSGAKAASPEKTSPLAERAAAERAAAGNVGEPASSGLRAIRGAARRGDFTSDFAAGEFGIDRYRAPRATPVKRPDGGRRVSNGLKPARHNTVASDCFADRSVEPVIQFLRSRDYSVVRVGEGRFQVDGRHILSADELREKADNVRKSLGQSPFLQLASSK